MTTGRCLCGQVTYDATGLPQSVEVCHCKDCQRWMGGPFIGVEVETLTTKGPLKWFASSEWGERGSCSVCGSSLLWRMRDGSHLTVTAGSFDDPSMFEGMEKQIFVDAKPAYFDFTSKCRRLTAAEFMAELSAQPATDND